MEMSERQIHDGFIAYLRKQGLCFVHHRMDKKSGIASGWPDFTIVHCGRVLLIEAKMPHGKLSVIQANVIADLQANGTPTVIARSVPECVGAVESWLGVENAATAVPESQNEASGAPQHKSFAEVCQETLFIGIIAGKNYVLSGDSGPGGAARLVRLATVADLINLRKQ